MKNEYWGFFILFFLCFVGKTLKKKQVRNYALILFFKSLSNTVKCKLQSTIVVLTLWLAGQAGDQSN